MIHSVPDCMGLISPEHSNNAVLKIFSASITSASSVLLHKENICFLPWNLQVESGHKNYPGLAAPFAFVMLNFDFIEGMS